MYARVFLTIHIRTKREIIGVIKHINDWLLFVTYVRGLAQIILR